MLKVSKILDQELLDWFQGSKVCLRPGKPMTLFRGITVTPEDRHASAILGIFLTPNKETATSYAGEGGTTHQYYVKICKPFLMSAMDLCEITTPEARALRRKLEGKGYDGIFVTPLGEPYPGDISEYIAFKPNQLRPV